MANPMHINGNPLGITFTNPDHNPISDGSVNGYYDTLTDLVTAAINVPMKDSAHLLLNDWLYAARIQNGDI